MLVGANRAVATGFVDQPRPRWGTTSRPESWEPQERQPRLPPLIFTLSQSGGTPEKHARPLADRPENELRRESAPLCPFSHDNIRHKAGHHTGSRRMRRGRAAGLADHAAGGLLYVVRPWQACVTGRTKALFFIIEQQGLAEGGGSATASGFRPTFGQLAGDRGSEPGWPANNRALFPT